MWKVMIADDEPKIRRGLKNSIEWHTLDMEIAGEAEDGEIALEQAKELKPDILLVDICMPFLNGLEFIERLREFLPESLVIVITGHDEFAYAHQAVRLRVFDYLLKPVSQNQLQAVLSKAKKELEQTMEIRKYMGWAEGQLKKNLPVLRERFFNEWISGRLTQFEIDEQLRFLDLKIDTPSGMILLKLAEKLGAEAVLQEKDRQVLLLAAQSIVEQKLEPLSPSVVFRDHNDNIVAITAYNRSEEWQSISEMLTCAIEQGLRQNAITRQTEIHGSLQDIAEVYAELSKGIVEENSLTPIVKSAKLYIDRNYHWEEINLDTVAAEIKISPSYLSRLLKQELGYSFIEYLTNVRIKKAIQLLNDPLIKVYEIAQRVGYNNQHYFSTSFKKVLGISPAEYRKGG